MAASGEKSSSYQSLGNGVYRVGGAVHRSAVTGRYVTNRSQTSTVRSAPSSGSAPTSARKR